MRSTSRQRVSLPVAARHSKAAKAVLRSSVINPTPELTQEPSAVTCKRCLRRMGLLEPLELDNEEDFE